jgi:ArsR family transcriptional regulator
MNTYQHEADQLKALAHPMRLALVDVLRSGEKCVVELQRHLHQRQPCISQHLRVLSDVGLVSRYREGLSMYYYLADPAFIEALCRALKLRCPSEMHVIPTNSYD